MRPFHREGALADQRPIKGKQADALVEQIEAKRDEVLVPQEQQRQARMQQAHLEHVQMQHGSLALGDPRWWISHVPRACLGPFHFVFVHRFTTRITRSVNSNENFRGSIVAGARALLEVRDARIVVENGVQGWNERQTLVGTRRNREKRRLVTATGAFRTWPRRMDV